MGADKRAYDFTERFDDEGALSPEGVRDGKARFGNALNAVENDVDVYGAGSIYAVAGRVKKRVVGRAAEMSLYFLAGGENVTAGGIEIKADGAVDEWSVCVEAPRRRLDK